MMSWPTSVRARLALSHGVALLVVVGAYAAVVYLQAYDGLYEQVDRQLANDFSLAANALADGMGAPALTSLSVEARHPNRRYPSWLEIWSEDGRLLSSRPEPAELAAVMNAPPHTRTSRASVALADGTAARVMSGPAATPDGPVLLRVGRSERQVREEIDELRAALAIGFPIALAFAVGAGYLLARRALSPVAAMTARARLITADRLTERLPITNPNDEFGQLATVFNAALARLEGAFATLRRFTADASHELRTPLTVIRSVGEVGLRDTRDAADYRDVIGSILEETDRLTGLVDALLTLSRADAGALPLSRNTFDLTALVRETGEVFGVLAEEKRQTLVISGEPVEVFADRAVVRQALVNLLDNAVKHSAAGAAVAVTVAASADGAIVEVLDTGPGIAEEHLGRIFDRFYRVDPARSREAGGAGLGLSISRWAVEAHGGRIAVESQPGRGSLFRVVLPLASQS